MGKSHRGHKEYTREQELKHEGKELRSLIKQLEGRIRELEKDNTRLRRQAAGSRKELARMDLDRHSYVRDIIEEHLADEQEVIDSDSLLAKMKAKWRCRECTQGHLEVFIYSKMGTPWYYRQCSECPNRTKSQPHHAGVEGPVKPLADTLSPSKPPKSGKGR